MNKLLQITSNYFCAGIEINGRAAPIIKYMRHWDEQRIRQYARSKGWRLIEVNATQATK